MIPFEFSKSHVQVEDGGCFLVDVPAGLKSKEELLHALAERGHFPNYFGSNWDALLDCLRDFEWVDEKRIVINHQDVPLPDDPLERRTYLEILQEAIHECSESRTAPSRDPLGARMPNHHLHIVFPESARKLIAESLSTHD